MICYHYTTGRTVGHDWGAIKMSNQFTRKVLAGLLLSCSMAIAQGAPTPPSAAGVSTSLIFKAYDVVFAEPDNMLPLVRELAGPNARVVYMSGTGRLLVYGDMAAHAAVTGALKEINVPARNVRVEVVFDSRERNSGVGAGVDGGARVTAGNGGTTWEAHARPRLSAGQSQTTSSTRQQLLTRSGGEASLAIGQEVPFLSELVQYGRRWGYIEEIYEMRQVGAFLWVQPTVLGDGTAVQVTLTPELSGLVKGGRRQRIRYKRVATTVTIRDGESLSLGEYGENSEFYDLFLAGMNQSARSSSTRITLTVHIE